MHGRVERVACADPNALRVAACIVGFARTFVRPSIHGSIAGMLRAMAPCVDTFGVVAQGEGDTAKGQAVRVPDDAMAPGVAMIKPVHWEDPGYSAESRHCGLPCMGQYAKFARCGEQIKQREVADGFRYHWILKLRPDVGYVGMNATSPAALRWETSILGQQDLRNGTFYRDSTLWKDLALIVPRHALDTVSTRVQTFPCNQTKTVAQTTSPRLQQRVKLLPTQYLCEELLFAALREAHVPVRTHRLQLTIERTEEAAAALAKLGFLRLHGKEAHRPSLPSSGSQRAAAAPAGPATPGVATRPQVLLT